MLSARVLSNLFYLQRQHDMSSAVFSQIFNVENPHNKIRLVSSLGEDKGFTGVCTKTDENGTQLFLKLVDILDVTFYNAMNKESSRTHL